LKNSRTQETRRPQGVASGALLPHRFFVVPETPCPYIAGRFERKLAVALPSDGGGTLLSQLTRAGFRRSHRFAYRPACQACSSCVPLRVPVADFRPSKSQQRTAKANAGLSGRFRRARATPEQFDLFRRYLWARHPEGEMSAMDFEAFAAMLADSSVTSLVYELRDPDGVLRAACLVDRLSDGLSAVYSFYDDDLPARSLGTQIILSLIGAAQEFSLDHLYLGYWIAETRKMAYKAKFRPFEVLRQGTWQRVPDTSGPVLIAGR